VRINGKLAGRAAAIIVSIFFLIQTAPLSGQDIPLLTLEECVRKGLKNDPQLVQAEAALTNATNRVWSAYGAFLPRVSTGLGYSRNSDPFPAKYEQQTVTIDGRDTVITVPIYTNDSYSQSLSLNQNLFNGFSDYFALKASLGSRNAARKSYENQILASIYGTKSAYYNVLRSMRLADVQKKAVERSAEQLKIIETRDELGSAALTDVLKARVSYGEARLNLIAAENSYRVSMAQLNHLIGEDVTKQFRIDTTVLVRQADYTLESALQQAIDNNPLLQSYKYSMESSKNSVRSAWGGFLPTLDFSYSASWFQPQSLELRDLYVDNRSHRYGLNLSFNLFDQFLTKRQISDARASYNTSRFNYHNYLNALKLEVTQSFLDYEQAQLSMQVSRDKLSSAQEDYKLAQEKYSLGAGIILDLLDAELSLKTAELDVIDSEHNMNLAIANLEKALGIIKY